MARREIVTKTILSKTKKFHSDVVEIKDDSVSKVLGCWLLNPVLRYEKRSDDAIIVSGTYDINLWVACANHTTTKCIIQTQEFAHTVILDAGDEEVIGEVIAFAKWLSKPLCTKADCSNGSLYLTIEQELQLEWIGETKLRVELVEDELDHIIDNQVDTQYLLK